MLDRCKEGIQAINFEVPFLGFFASRGLFLCVSVVNTVCGGLKLTCFSCVIKSLFLRGTFYNEATSKSCRDKSNSSVHNVLDVFFLYFLFLFELTQLRVRICVTVRIPMAAAVTKRDC